MAKKEKSRFYSFKVVSYASRDELQSLLDASKHWVLILHDKDETDNHYHILVTFHRELSFKKVRDLVVSEFNTLVNPLEDWIGDYEYLTHKNAPEKYQYPESALESCDLTFWKQKAHIKQSVEEYDFVRDLFDGVLTYRQMATRYGRDYMKNFRAYEEFRYAAIFQEEQIEAKKRSWADHLDDVEVLPIDSSICEFEQSSMEDD